MDREKAIKELADLIEKNPECSFEIDNDCWYVSDASGKEIAHYKQYNFRTDWYGHSSNYGFGLAEVLVELLNRRGFKIDASAV